MYIISERKKARPESVGKKAWNLFLLSEHFAIPKFVVVSTDAFKEYLNSKSIRSKLMQELTITFEQFLRKGPLAIRSSGTAEDLQGISFAGMYTTVLNVTNVDTKEAVTLPLPEVSDDPLEMGQADQQQQQTMLRRAAEKVAEQEGARVIVFGHTHYPVQEPLSNGSVYINTGSWVQDLSDARPEIWEALFNGSQRPNDLALPLPYVRIDYDEYNMPSAKLLYFNKGAGIKNFFEEKFLSNISEHF